MAGDAEMQPADSATTLSGLAGLMGEDTEAEQEEQEQEATEVAEEEEAEEQEAEETEEEEEQEDEPTFVIKHDGKEVTLKQSELIAQAQQGFDYSKKTMALAEDRKSLEAAREQAESYRQNNEAALQNTLNRLNTFVKFTEANLGSPPPLELLQSDPPLYMLRKEQYEIEKGKLHRAHEAISNVEQEAQRSRQARIVQQAEETEKALRDTLPGWNDKTLDELVAYAEKVGLTPKTANDAFVQKGLWELAYKAKAYDDIQAKKADLKPVAQLAKVAKPQASNPPNRVQVQRKEAFQRHAAKGTLDSLADLL